jgi:hypothetical protein
MSAGTAWPGPRTSNGEAVRRGRAYVDAQQHQQGARVAGWQLDDSIPALSSQKGARLLATAEGLMGHCRRGSPAVAAGRQAR